MTVAEIDHLLDRLSTLRKTLMSDNAAPTPAASAPSPTAMVEQALAAYKAELMAKVEAAIHKVIAWSGWLAFGATVVYHFTR